MDRDRLAEYRGKRDASRTPEPVPAEEPHAVAGSAASGVFVIQEHHARRLHWDFRLERDGVLVSWALPKGVPDDPAVNHLAVHTEDHPMEYATFQGQIPVGEYGGGAVTIWDRGTYETLKWADREVKVTLHGERVTGGYVLFATGGKNWMIHRERLALPAELTPMLASPGSPPVRDLAAWAVEMKWDGVRALALIEAGRLRLVSRTGKEITATYPEVSALGHAVKHKQVLLDGEIVVLTGGRADFEALQPRMHVTSPTQALRLAEQTPVTYLTFDVLQLDGRPLTGLPYAERRKILESIIPNGGGWLSPPSFPGEDLEAVRAASVANGLEGVVAKRLDSAYEPGTRSRNWLKIKNLLMQEVVVAGWKPGKGNRTGQIGSLLIGLHEGGDLVYCGHVGTGFSDATLRMLGQRLEPLRRPDSPFDGPVPAEHARGAVWVEPRLVAEVAFDSWTRAGRMRAPSYRGLRDDKDPAEVVRET
ncbi:DNA ligase [Trebonia kvetii]|uniref:DNA ligase (ATP) n=1 Tax=Trebonia kvetii TaxID=2480626 RepID=A0A6P2BM92_9ACTN|nr:non-homologous end-joining DNA ligase [Trebonia kvetii]TVZ00072.1 DNA ligase [Trebonia kvetii]